MNDNVLLHVQNLKKYFTTSYGVVKAVDGVTFDIKKGETLGVVGESGSGKSTLGRTVLRLHEPTSGQIIFDGQDLMKVNKNALKKSRMHMQMIFQDPYSSLNPRMTVSQTIASPFIIQGIYKGNQSDALQNKVHEVMELVGIPKRIANSYPHELDGGRRQRVGIARALALNPKFIVCDEPVSALDVSIQAQILNLMQDLQEKLSFTYMFITHDLSVVKHLSDNIMVMYLGEMVEMAPSKLLFSNPLHPYTQALLSAIPVPDPKVTSNRIILRGEIGTPINTPKGCRFANRCLYGVNDCQNVRVEYIEVEPNHLVACHMFNESSQFVYQRRERSKV